MATARMLLSSPRFEEHTVHVSDIQWNTEQLSIKIMHTAIKLTKAEYKLLFSLRTGTPVTYTSLAKQVYNYPEMDDKIRLMLDKHVDRVRGKLRGTGIYIYCVLGYGYLLLPELSTD